MIASGYYLTAMNLIAMNGLWLIKMGLYETHQILYCSFGQLTNLTRK